jgi:hypothetical protein
MLTQAIRKNSAMVIRTAPPSHFCTAWKLTPSRSASIVCVIRSVRRRWRTRCPICTSTAFHSWVSVFSLRAGAAFSAGEPSLSHVAGLPFPPGHRFLRLIRVFGWTLRTAS